ncbi:MAG: class I SAM-dependent RNA methyltransferase [Candidatus Gracilibacteria bacterium]|nr:class I SAM-dependent RNA methyltransferase [Candidatus Gracilibacteria bacterium]
MNIILTTIAGVEALAKKEVERLGFEIIEVKDKLIKIKGDFHEVAMLNLWSRVANKVYIELACKKVDSFDDLFDLVSSVDWKYYIRDYNPIIVNAATTRSSLESEKTIQSITKKAIIKKLSGDNIRQELANIPEISILVLIIDGEAKIMLNTTGEALHKRGYRENSLEAPIKESLAASLVLLSNWSFKDNFYDPFCGSGTIAIEAALIARNIAPGLYRRFAFEKFAWFPKHYIENAVKDAEEKIIRDKKYSIFASDISPEAIEIARDNARKAGVIDTIRFKVADIRDFVENSRAVVEYRKEKESAKIEFKKAGEISQNETKKEGKMNFLAKYEEKNNFDEQESLTGTLVSNPPYGLRLEQDDIYEIHDTINTIFKTNKKLKGGIITSFEEFDKIIMKKFWKTRKLYNGRELCYFYTKATDNTRGYRR